MNSKVANSPTVYKNPHWSVCALEGDDTDPHFVVRLPDSVCTIGRTSRREYVLVRIYRPAHQRCILEWPGGGIHPREDPRVAALRELHEETGLTAEGATLVASIRPSTGLTTELCHIVTVDIDPSAAVSVGPEVVEVLSIKDYRVASELLQQGGDSVALAAWTVAQGLSHG